ncbi:hypothetical protein ACFWPK_25575 [Nocardia sp. NPDC058519]|uniref:hypothetical protein n=1 Tax=unclassified Nocardia TaxID=2637762 RepID=UPI00365000E5
MPFQDSGREVCVVTTLRGDDEWIVAFVIDGRKYPSAADFDRVVRDAFIQINRRWRLIAEFETRAVGIGEPDYEFPSWEDFRGMLERGEWAG